MAYFRSFSKSRSPDWAREIILAPIMDLWAKSPTPVSMQTRQNYIIWASGRVWSLLLSALHRLALDTWHRWARAPEN